MRFALIDSNYLCYRAHLTTGYLQHGSIRTGVIFGFFNQLLTIAQKLNPDQFIFFWDSKKSKRKEIFPQYKEKRRQNQTEQEIEEWRIAFAQFRQLRKSILPKLGFNNNFLQSGYESDDLIAEYVLTYGAERDRNYVVTADDDLLQLLNHCHIYNPSKDQLTMREDFFSQHSLDPSMWKEVKKIAGCSSDCVPGIEGVGEKTALKYLKGELKRSTKAYQKIIDGKDVIERNEKLVVLPFEGTELINVEEDNFKMIEFLRMCRKFNMSSFRTDEKKEQIKQLFKGE